MCVKSPAAFTIILIGGINAAGVAAQAATLCMRRSDQKVWRTPVITPN
jgi:hypothetical protein